MCEKPSITGVRQVILSFSMSHVEFECLIPPIPSGSTGDLYNACGSMTRLRYMQRLEWTFLAPWYSTCSQVVVLSEEKAITLACKVHNRTEGLLFEPQPLDQVRLIHTYS